MPIRKIHHSRISPRFTQDFPCRLARFKESSGLNWAELARCLGTDPFAVRRWRSGAHPNSRQLRALRDLANTLSFRGSLTTPAVEGPPLKLALTRGPPYQEFLSRHPPLANSQ